MLRCFEVFQLTSTLGLSARVMRHDNLDEMSGNIGLALTSHHNATHTQNTGESLQLCR